MTNFNRVLFLYFLAIFIAFPIFSQNKDLVPSHVIHGDWNDYFRFVVNEGENAVNFEKLLLSEILNYSKVKKMPGYTSPEHTKFPISTYEFSHRGVFDRIRDGIEKGFKFEITVDGNILQEFKPLSDKQIEKLTDHQKEYYYRNYNLDSSSEKVTAKDAKLFNTKYLHAKWIWKNLQELQKKKPGFLKLNFSPAETVPGLGLNFPRIHHWKEYAIQFYENGRWVMKKSFIPSSNLTTTCLNHEQGRVSASFVNNNLRYVRANKAQWDKALKEKKITQRSYDQYMKANGDDKFNIAYAKTSKHPVTGKPLRSGHVQFGQLFTNGSLLELFRGNPIARWVNQYRKNKTFDYAPARKSYLPEVIFEDPKTGSISKLRAYYSEGKQSINADTDFVATVYNSIFSDPGNSIRVFKSTQFVTTHPRIMNRLAQAMSREDFEELFMVVDGNFSSETYSALPSLAGSTINDGSFTPWTKAIIDSPLNQEQKIKALNSIYSFDGHQGINGGKDGVKLHAKMSYIEYVDSHNIRHYVVIHGSGNLSVNAGKGNADGLILFDTTDEGLRDQIAPYFKGMKENIRTKRFLETLLQKRLAHMVDYNEQSTKEVKKNGFVTSKEAKFIEKNIGLLEITGGKLTSEFARVMTDKMPLNAEKETLLDVVSELSKQTKLNNSAYGKNFIKLLRFYITLDTHFGFDQLLQVFHLANPQKHPYQGFLKRVEFEWLKRKTTEEKTTLSKKFKTLVNRLARFENGHEKILTSALGREMLHKCGLLFTKSSGSKDSKRLSDKGSKK